MSDTVTTGSTNVYRIEPLKGAENYAVWKIKMMDILTDQGLWDYVTETAPTDPDLLSAWNKKDRTALSTIRLRIADKLLVYVASAKTAKAAWEALKNLLETQGALGIVLARNYFELSARKARALKTIFGHYANIRRNYIIWDRNKRTENSLSFCLHRCRTAGIITFHLSTVLKGASRFKFTI